MDLGFQGQSITKEEFGYAVLIFLTGGYEISIETDFSVHTPAGNFQLSPGPDETGSNTDRLRTLREKKVTSARVDESGTLTITFADGASLRVNPDDSYEAWSVAGPHGMRVICMPRGELAVWEPEDGT